MWPSTDPEKTTPGMMVTAADCAGLQNARPSQEGGFAAQILSPVTILIANSPPPLLGSRTRRSPRSNEGLVKEMSELATYILRPSDAEPHWIPPSGLPVPTRCSQ